MSEEINKDKIEKPSLLDRAIGGLGMLWLRGMPLEQDLLLRQQ